MRSGQRVAARWAAVAGLALTLGACSPLTQPGGDWLRGPTRPALFPQVEATVLGDGRVLVASSGQAAGASSPAELVQLFDPSSNRWSAASDYPAGWTPGPGVLLRDGSVLFTPGQAGDALRYLPRSDRWVPAGRMIGPGAPDALIRLADGRVIALGGPQGPGGPPAAPQIYDPARDAWTHAAPMRDGRSGLSATLLQDGSVLVVGGADAGGSPVITAERYDPATNTWSIAGREQIPSLRSTAITLPGGQALVIDAFNPFGGDFPYTQLYDPRSNSWRFGPSQPSAGNGPLIALSDGRILMLKQRTNSTSALFRGEILDPRSRTWSVTPVTSGLPATLAPLPGARVLAIAQQTDWIFDPNAIPPPEPGRRGLGSPQLTLLLGAVAALLAFLVLGQYLLARAAERRRLRPVSPPQSG